MMFDTWGILSINDVCTVIDCQHKTAPAVDEKTPYRMLRTVNIRNGKLVDIENTKSVTKETYDKWSVRGYLSSGDVLLTREAPMGEVALLKDEKYKFFLGQRILQLKAKENVITPEFLYYSLQTPNLRHQIMMNEGTGSVVSNIRIPLLLKMTLKVPNIEMQKEITAVLEKIDEKIALNKKLILNLESISSLLFKNWFIDFEFPNEQGLPYRTSGGEMVQTELGEIPSGWKVVKLQDVTKLYKSTFNPKKSDEVEVKHFSLPAFDSKKYPTIDKVTDIKSNKWIVEDNCVLFSKMNPITPRIWIPKIHSQFLNVASSEFVVLKNDTFAESAFIYSLCASHEFIEYLKANATGSTNSRQRITPDKALEFKFATNCDVMTTLSNVLAPFVEKLRGLHEENNKLEELRDTLLPKLLSGEIEIPNESVVEPS